LRAGTTTRVATRSAGIDGEGLGAAVPGGGIVGSATDGGGGAVAGMSVGPGVCVGSTAPVYVSSPPAISDTPTAVRMAGRRRLRSAPTLLTGAACYQRAV
jgi:hypothetical protein